MNLSDKLRNLRTESHFTQQKVADYLEIDRSTYAYYETGATKPSIKCLQKLSQLYNVSIDAIIGDGKCNKVRVASPHDEVSCNYTVSQEELEIINMFRELSDERKIAFVNFLKTFNS